MVGGLLATLDRHSAPSEFQLHVGGALPPGRDARWANSPQGVLYAMQHMASSGAAGLRGLAAIRAIVTRFERPAAPGPEVWRSLGTYKGWNGSGGSLPAPQGGPVIDLKALQQQQTQTLAKALLGQQAVFKKQLAAQNQSRLVQQLQATAQAHIEGARTAQQSLSAGGSVSGSDPQTTLGALSRQRLDDLRLQALRRAGIA